MSVHVTRVEVPPEENPNGWYLATCACGWKGARKVQSIELAKSMAFVHRQLSK